MQLLQPGARARAKSAQVHGIDDFLACYSRLHNYRDNEWGKPLNARNNTALQFVQLVTAGTLCIHGDDQVARKGWHETESQVHGKRNFIRDAHSSEGCAINIRI